MSDEDPTAIFEPLYVAAAEGHETLRWDRGGPHPLVEEWARDLSGSDRRALVVGSGLGPDAELFTERGFAVVGFDVSPTAIATARERFPRSVVDYVVANLLDPPAEWTRAFDLVVESLTVQSLPVAFHAQAIANIARMVAPGGTLLVVAKARDEAGGPVDGPPWPVTRAEIESFAGHGLQAVRIENATCARPPTSPTTTAPAGSTAPPPPHRRPQVEARPTTRSATSTDKPTTPFNTSRTAYAPADPVALGHLRQRHQRDMTTRRQ